MTTSDPTRRLLRALKRGGAALLLAGAATLLAPAAADADPPAERQRVEVLLDAYDTPATAKQLEASAKDPRATLLKIARDGDVPERRRRAALHALSHFPNPEVRALYLQVMKRADGAQEAPRPVHDAIMSLARAFGEDALIEIEPLLTHQDVQVRLTVAHAAATFCGEPGRALLRAHVEREKDIVVIDEIERLAATVR